MFNFSSKSSNKPDDKAKMKMMGNSDKKMAKGKKKGIDASPSSKILAKFMGK